MKKWLRQRRKAAAYVATIATLALSYHVIPEAYVNYVEFGVAVGGLYGVHRIPNEPV